MSKLQTALNLANLSLAAILLSGLAGHAPAPAATAPLVSCDCVAAPDFVVSPKRAHKARHKRVDGMALIRRFEGLRLTAYPDPVTHGAPWTICYGRTGPMVHKGLTVSRGQCEAWLKADYAKARRAKSLNGHMSVKPMWRRYFSAEPLKCKPLRYEVQLFCANAHFSFALCK